MPRALGLRRAQTSGTPPLSLDRRRHRLTIFATLPLSLSPSPEATEPGRCPGFPPLPRHHSPPPESHPSLRSREISRLTGPTLRETRLRTRARPHESARVLALGGVSRAPRVPASVQPGRAQLAVFFCHAGVRCIHFTQKSEKEEFISSPPLFSLSKTSAPDTRANEKLALACRICSSYTPRFNYSVEFRGKLGSVIST